MREASRRRLLSIALPALAVGTDARAGADPWAAIRTPGSVALIRHALAPGTFDPAGFRIDDCSTQRNLSADGRAQATRIGDRFRANGIAAAAVHSSQWCRCLETAALLKLGSVSRQPLLNSFVQDADQAARQVPSVKAWLAGLDLDRPTVLVTHQVVITALSDVFPGSGEIVVLRRLPAGGLSTEGRIATE
jgi:broad specificity phosphatase PhoE